MAKYKEQWPNPLTPVIIGYTDTETSESIPKLDGNIEYEEVLAWIAEGNTPDPAHTQAEIDAFQATMDRAQDIEDAQEATGMRGLTVDEAQQLIIDRIDIVRLLPESNLAEIQAKIGELCDQVEWLFKKVAIFLLK